MGDIQNLFYDEIRARVMSQTAVEAIQKIKSRSIAVNKKDVRRLENRFVDRLTNFVLFEAQNLWITPNFSKQLSILSFLTVEKCQIQFYNWKKIIESKTYNGLSSTAWLNIKSYEISFLSLFKMNNSQASF